MPAQTQERMHRDHLLWQQSIAAWQSALRCWQLEMQTALKTLAKIEQVVQEHATELESHCQAIERDLRQIAAHEHAIQRRAGSPEDDPALAASHAIEADNHRRRRQAQERLRERHYCVVRELDTLKARLES